MRTETKHIFEFDSGCIIIKPGAKYITFYSNTSAIASYFTKENLKEVLKFMETL